ncbi:MAG TPA: hypothetical protein VMT09_03325 [Steroidobacteraceae bacterium]|nr:hypothetical protein [Steroidobacteraceae bacterium]
MGPAGAASPDEAERQRRVRRSAVLFAVIAAGFYLAFIAVMLARAAR